MTRSLCVLNGVDGKHGRYDAATMARFTVLEHPLAGDLLTRLRDRETGPAEYRSLARRLGRLLVIEATRDLPTQARAVQTPLEPFEGTELATGVVVIPVLRAGLSLLDAVVDLYPDAVVGYLGMERTSTRTNPATTTRSSLPCRAGARWSLIRCWPRAGRAARRCGT